jgi:23S rRNA (uracil1939-C5)-methyltransferase
VVFVPGVCPGEEVRARILSVKKGYAQAELETVLRPSPDRVEPPCPVFGKCGGCQWQQIAYPAQLRAKVEILREDLRRIGKRADADLRPPLAAPDPYEYRMRIQLKLDLSRKKPAIGYYAARSHRLVPIERCPIAGPPLNRALEAMIPILSEPADRLPSMTDVHLHLAPAGGELQVRYFAEDEPRERVEWIFTRVEEALPNLVSQVYYGRTGRRWIRGRDYLIDRYKDVSFRIGDRSFSQVNGKQIPALIDTVLAFSSLTGNESVLELFCGIGTFGIFLARAGSALMGFDENLIAVEDANYNARQQELANALFTAKPVEQAVTDLVEEEKTFDCVVLDPPREGMNRNTLKWLVRLKAFRIVYVSCDTATLSRDIKILADAGYRAGRIQPIDLFPQTYHLETVAELIKT